MGTTSNCQFEPECRDGRWRAGVGDANDRQIQEAESGKRSKIGCQFSERVRSRMEPQSVVHTIVELKLDAALVHAPDRDVELGGEVTISTAGRSR